MATRKSRNVTGREPTRSDVPYLPIKGINPDARRLTSGPEEAYLMENFRPDIDYLSPRPGFFRLADNVPTGDPIIHYHRFSDDTDDLVLFAFTKNNIFKFTQSANAWEGVLDTQLIDDCESAVGYTSPGSIVTNTDLVYTPSSSLKTEATVVSGTPIYTSAAFGALDLSSYSTIRFSYLYVPADGISFGGSLKVYAGAVLKETIAFTFNDAAHEQIGGWKRASLDIAVPANWNAITKYEILYTSAATPQIILLWVDDVRASNPLTSDVEYWSTTDFIDTTNGKMIIAAGSNPPTPGEGEDDYGERVLLEYQPSVDLFMPYSLRDRINVADEDTTEVIPAVAGSVPASPQSLAKEVSDADWISLVDEGGLLTFYTLEYGALGTASFLEIAGGKFPIVPTPGSPIVGGTGSWVSVDGTDWLLTFTNTAAPITALPIYVQYTYYRTSSIKPRIVRQLDSHLVLLNTASTSAGGDEYFPWQVLWSHPGSFDDFFSLDFVNVTKTDTSPIVAAEPLGTYLQIYKTESGVRMFHVQSEIPQTFRDSDASFNFLTNLLQGTYAYRSIVSHNNIHFFLGKDDVYAFNGETLQEISHNPETGASRIIQTLLKEINKGLIHLCRGMYYPKFREYWLFVIRQGETYPTKTYVYSERYNAWYNFTFPKGIVALSTFRRSPRVAIQDLVGNIEDQNWFLGDASISDIYEVPICSAADGDSYILEETLNSDFGYTDESTGAFVQGTEIEPVVITRDFVYRSLGRTDRTTRVIIDAEALSIFVGISGDAAISEGQFKQLETITPDRFDKEFFYNPDIVARAVRLYLKFPKSSRFKYIQPFAKEADIYNE